MLPIAFHELLRYERDFHGKRFSLDCIHPMAVCNIGLKLTNVKSSFTFWVNEDFLLAGVAAASFMTNLKYLLASASRLSPATGHLVAEGLDLARRHPGPTLMA